MGNARPTSVLVAYCACGQTYYEIERARELCECCGYEPHRLRKRRGYICEECETKDIFFTAKAYRGHGHD